MGKIKEHLKRTPFYPFFQRLQRIQTAIIEQVDLLRWNIQNNPTAPPPRLAKQRILLQKTRQFKKNVFIETGTYLGDMVQVIIRDYQTIHSIEIEPTLCTNAQHRFQENSNVQIHCGDSSTVLPKILSDLHEPAFFWLDGHYSGGITGRGVLETPIEKELQQIARHHIRGHFILIDDARCFVGSHDYPTLEALKQTLHTIRPDAIWQVQHDMISIQL